MKTKKLEWINEKRKLSDLIPFENNPRYLTDKQKEDLKKSLEKFSLVEVPIIDTDNKIIAGHQRIKVLKELEGDIEIDVRIPNRKLTQKEFDEYCVRSNKNTGEWDWTKLEKCFEVPDLVEWGFEKFEIIFDKDDINDAFDKLEDKKGEKKEKKCPHCGGKL